LKKQNIIIIIALIALVVSTIIVFRYEIVFRLYNGVIFDGQTDKNTEIDKKLREWLPTIVKSDPHGFKTVLLKNLAAANEKKANTAFFLMEGIVKLPSSEYIRIYKDSASVEYRNKLLCLMEPDSQESLNFIYGKLNNPQTEPLLQTTCLRKMWEVHDPAMVASCRKFLYDPEPQVRRFAVLLFAITKTGDYTEDLIKKFNDKNPEVSYFAILRAVDKTPGLYRKDYLKALKDNDWRVVMVAIAAVGFNRDKKAIPLLKELIKTTKNEDVRDFAATMLDGLENGSASSSGNGKP
jgi:hypothetical protein